MRFSERTGRERTDNRLAVLLRQTRARRPVLDLTVSNPTEADLDYPAEAILGAMSDPAGLRYAPEPLGLARAREAVAAEVSRDGIAVAPSRVALTASTSEAYGFLFKVLCDPGDEVLVPRPSYPLFDMLAAFESVRAVPYRLAYDGEWHVDLDSLRRAVTTRTRAIVAVSPNNPTGSYLKTTELAALAALGLPIVSDQVFAPYVLDETAGRARTALEADAELVCVLGGLSKQAALPQVKLAWIALGGAERAVAETLGRLELVADTWLSVSTPAQVAAPSLLEATGSVQRAIHARLRRNLAALRRRSDGSAATVLRVEGGWYAILRLPRIHDSERWCTLLLEEDGVWVHPGFFFDFEDEGYVVVSLLTPEPAFDDGAGRLLARVERECR